MKLDFIQLMKIWNKLKLQQLHLIDSENKELACGDKTRLMIGGFSGGGVVALNLLLKSKEKLGGCIALSCYIPGTLKT